MRTPILLSLLALAACGGADPETSSAEATPAEAPEQAAPIEVRYYLIADS